MPSVELHEPVIDSDGHASAVMRFPSTALPPSFRLPTQFLDEPVVPPGDRRVAELRHLEFYRIEPL